MIQIQPENNKAVLRELCRIANLAYSDKITGAVMLDGNERLGFSLFELQDGYALIYALEPAEDLSLADGMLRSTIHIALTNNCLSVYYADSAPKEVFEALGFVMNKEKKQLNTHKLFEACGGCK